MMILFLISCAFAQYVLPAECKKWDSKKTFNACNYNTFNKKATDKPFTTGNELYVRDKCTTCCRVLFVSEYNYATGKRFTTADYKNDKVVIHTMDEEFDWIENVRTATGSYEQCILLRPIEAGKTTQYWEFAPYMMYVAFNIPLRVHDIRGGANAGSKLIIWKKKPPLDAGTNNQRFIYIHPYVDDYYPVDSKNTHVYTRGKTFKKHFFVPFQKSALLCYAAMEKGKKTGTYEWAGNKGYSYGNTYQIQAKKCDNADDTQYFVPVFA